MQKQLIIAFLLFACTIANAQQLSQFSQYLDNFYLVNPAATDVQNNVNLGFGYRQQWSDLPGNPSTFYLTAYAPLTKPQESQYMQASMRLSDQLRAKRLKLGDAPTPNHIIGTTISNDNFGLFNKTTIHATYSFHLPITQKLTLSAAPKLGFVRLSLNDNLWVLEENDVPFEDFVNKFQAETLLDLGAGLWLYSDKLFFGYSIEQLSKNRSTQLDGSVGFEFKPHHFIVAGYRLNLNNYLRLVPNVMVRHLETGPSSIDYSMRLEYAHRIWAGISYRKENAIVGSFGLFITNELRFNYSYDHGTSKGGRDGLNAHEISLRISLFPNLHKR